MEGSFFRVYLVLANARWRRANGNPVPLRIRKKYMPANMNKTYHRTFASASVQPTTALKAPRGNENEKRTLNPATPRTMPKSLQ